MQPSSTASVIAVLCCVACATDPIDEADDPGDDDDGKADGAGATPLGPHQAAPFTVTDPTDGDGDQIADQLEDYLIAKFAPQVRLAPDDIDWTRPANVEWYLANVHMRFDHPKCGDHQVLALGAVNTTTVWQQTHATSTGFEPFCGHSDTALRSGPDNGTWTQHKDFFLQPEDDGLVHPGIPPSRSAEWQVYAHVKPSGYVRADGVAAAYDIQIWFFYAYNDFIGGINHESDWEHMTISVSETLEPVSIYFATHGDGSRIDDLAKVKWVGRTHPVGYAADGSHATYPTAGTHALGVPGANDHTYDAGPIWKTWTNAVNLGERGRVINDQFWARYDGRWGEKGNIEDTSGPVGPMYNSRWPIKGSEY